jgi:hypothetical protein
VWGNSPALRLLSSLVAWLVAYSSVSNHSCWSPLAGPALIPILSGTISSPQFHCHIYGLRLEMKNKGRSCTIIHSTEVLILIASTLLIYPYFICKFFWTSFIRIQFLCQSLLVRWRHHSIVKCLFLQFFVPLVDTASWDSYFFLVPFLHKMFVWLFVLTVVMLQNVINMILSSKSSP